MIEKFIHFQKGQKKMANLWQMSSFINALNVTSEMVKPLFLQFYYLFILFTYTLIFTTIWSTNMLSMFMCWFWTVILGVCAQVRGNSDGGVGSVVDGVSFPEYQAVCGELFTHGSQTAGIQRTWFASAGHQLGKFVWVWLNKPANAFLNLCRRSERFRWKTRNGFDCYSAIYFMVFFFFFSPLLRCFSLSLYLFSLLSLSLSLSLSSLSSLSLLTQFYAVLFLIWVFQICSQCIWSVAKILLHWIV